MPNFKIFGRKKVQELQECFEFFKVLQSVFSFSIIFGHLIERLDALHWTFADFRFTIFLIILNYLRLNFQKLELN